MSKLFTPIPVSCVYIIQLYNQIITNPHLYALNLRTICHAVLLIESRCNTNSTRQYRPQNKLTTLSGVGVDPLQGITRSNGIT